MSLPAPLCEWGHPWHQILEILPPERHEGFRSWMQGQSMVYCTGQRYNHDLGRYEMACGGESHGTVVYPWDFENFLAWRPIID